MEETDYFLVILSLGHVRGADKQRNPIVSTIAIQMSSMEIVSLEIISSVLIDKHDNIDLISLVNIFFKPLKDQSDVSSLLV